jgi:biotin carboxyl carrier protein
MPGQDVEIVYPSTPEATYVCRSSGDLETRHGPGTLCSVPLRRAGKPVAVLTLERPTDKPFGLEEVETLRLASDLATARLLDLHDHDRWLGAKAAAATRKALAKAIGPEYTWIKVAAIAVLASILFLTLVKGADRVEAPFLIEATQRAFIPAPFTGYVLGSDVEPGTKVEARKTVLAVLDTADLKLELEASRAEQAAYGKQAMIAMRDGKTADMQMYEEQANKTAAQIKLLERHVSQAAITAPLDGWVVNGDLKPQLGKKVEIGDTLFEVAPVDALRAELQVPEDRIADLKPDQHGQLATAAAPGGYYDFTIERINPVAQVVNQKNVFQVRVKFDQPAELFMRPGMGGVAMVDVGRRTYGYMWTRSLVSWVRMKLWI